MTFFFDSLAAGLISSGLFLMVRNMFVYEVRTAFIDDPTLWPEVYNALPTYDQMMCNPKYWVLWTKDQWVIYMGKDCETK